MRSYHWWIYGVDPNTGKPFLIYGSPIESECRQKALEMLSGIDFKLKRLATRDITAASRQLRGYKLDKTHNITRSMRKLGHDKTMRRIQEKRRRIF